MKNFIQRVFFPSYKRTISVLVVLILVLSVPITLRLVGQQQDLRQRAEGLGSLSETQIGCTSTAGNGQLVTYYCSDSNTWTYDIYSSDRSRKENTYSSKCFGTSTCITKNSCVYCQEVPTATVPTTGNCGTQNCDSSQTCIYNYSGGSAVCFSKGTAGTGAYCGSPTGPNNEACRSGSCDSNSLCVDTLGGGGGTSGGAPAAPTSAPATLPAPSVSGQGYTGGCNSITLTWGAVPGATSYIIRQYNQAGVAESAFDKTFTATGTSYTVTDLISNPLTAYFFNIYATNGTTTSPKASILAATGACTIGQVSPSTTTTTTELARPSVSGQGYTGGCNSISLTWGAVTGATSYIIKQYNETGAAESASNATYTTASTNYTVTNLISNPLTAYFFNIYATNGSITSPKSSILAATGACTTTQTCSAATCAAPSTCVNNVCTAPNTTATTTNFTFTASLPGIASGGLGRNANPRKSSRAFSIAVFPPNTQTKGLDGITGSIQQANLVFNGSSIYTGTVALTRITNGSYLIKVKTDNSTWKSLGIQTLTQGSMTTATGTVALVTGDLNNNNGLDVGDYSSMISCIKNSCDGNTKSLADLNDDSLVDEVDLNILYSGFSNRNGD